MYKEKVCSVGRTLKHFWMAQLNYLFFSNLKTSDLNGLGGRLRSFEAVLSYILVCHFIKVQTTFLIDFWALTTMASEAGHELGEGLLHGYDSETFFDGITELLMFQRPQNI